MAEPIFLTSSSPEETLEIAKKIIKDLRNKNILRFFGDLGVGKTVFVKGIANAFGIEDYSVKSPTYTLIREYPHAKGMLVHVDLYRLNEPDEVLFKQLNEYASNKNNLILIEWAEKLTQDVFDIKLKENMADICMEYIDRTSRKITVFI